MAGTLNKHITTIPSVKYTELWYYILAHDIVVVPSLAEWFWFAAAEVCALDKELVVTNIGSLPEVVSGKINFVEPADSRSIEEWILNFYHKNFLSIEKKEFFWSDNVEKTLEIYSNIIN